MKYIIIGNGIAGISAAQSIRKNDEEGEITIISRSKYPHYYRPGLIEYLRGEKSLEKLIIFKPDFYEKNRINNILNREITSINGGERSILDKDGEVYEYDRLLLTSGGIPWLPLSGGGNISGVFSLRGVNDADSIMDYCRDREKVVVIGGGLLGLETAGSLSSMGKEVTVIEYAPTLLPRQLDEEGGNVLMDILSERGISFFMNESVNNINTENNSVKSVELKSGESIEAHAVIISAGVTPDVSLARDSGMDINRGVVVNNFLETSIEKIYAAGDVAEHNGIVYGLWTAAMEQGRVAGENMAGEENEYRGTVPSTMLKVSGINLFSAGDATDSESEINVLSEGNKYAKFLSREDSPLGSVVIGDMEVIKLARGFMNGKVGIEEIREFVKNNSTIQ